MRWALALAAACAVVCFSGAGARAQSLQCLQETNAAARAACAEREIDDLRDQTRYWRRAAQQTEDDVGYWERQRARCRGDFMCVARQYQMETSELQVRIEPAVRARAMQDYPGVVAYDLAGGPNDLASLIDAIIMDDSRHWMWNNYDRGSVRNVRIIENRTDYMLVHADYSYNNGSRGWVQARVVGGEVSCLEYHDFAGRCRPVGTQSYAYGETANFALSMLAQAALQALTTPR